MYVCGEVASPGVYELQEGDRITHAIEAAGGLTEAAGQVYLNQAKTSDRWTKDLCTIQRRRTDFERRRFTIGYG